MGFLIFLLGIFFIITEQVFLGVLAIIVAILIFPNRKSVSSSYHHFDNDHNDKSYSFDSDSGGGDSGGGGGD